MSGPSFEVDGDPMESLFQQTFSDVDFEDEYVEAKILGRMFDLPVPPPKIGRFEIRERLGSGGMGDVYSAWDPELRRMVALKLDRVDGRERDELLREARVHARVESPHVLPVYDVGIHGDHVYMAMKIVQGQTLASWQARDRSLNDILSVYAQAARGLAEIHRSGIVHCDFKPTNVLVDADNRVWVADFGLARFFPEEVGAGGGTRGYMAPERMFDDLSTPASDQFSFCVSLFEAVHAASPFPGPPQSLGQRLARCEVVLPPNARAVPKWVRALLERGLRREPRERFPHMVALLAELTRDRNTVRTGKCTPAIIAATLLLGLALHPEPEPEPGVHSLAGVWDDSRRGQLENHFSVLHTSWITTSQPLIFGQLDEWAKRWSSEWWQSGVSLLFGFDDGQARFDCLLDQRAWVGETVASFLEAGPTLLWSAPLITADLPAPERCRSAVRSRPAAIDENEAALLQGKLARANALRSARRHDESRAIADELLAKVDDWPALRIDALRERGRSWFEAGRTQLAIEDLLSASELAIEQGEWDRAAELHADVARVVDAASGLDPEATERRIRGTLETMGPKESLRMVENLHALALALDARSRDFGDEAGVAYQVAIDRSESILGRGHPLTADVLADAGRHALGHGDRRIARDRSSRALELRHASLPAHHPLIARSLLELAEFERAAGNFGAAVAFVHAAIVVGCERDREHSAFALLGALHAERSEWSAAAHWYQQALRAHPGPDCRRERLEAKLAAALARKGGGPSATFPFHRSRDWPEFGIDDPHGAAANSVSTISGASTHSL
jgi:serine/threonine protein kinase